VASMAEPKTQIVAPMQHFIFMCRLHGIKLRIEADGRIRGPNGTIELQPDGRLLCRAMVRSNEVKLATLWAEPRKVEATLTFDVDDLTLGSAALVNIGVAKLP
jgi:hypothetical protein